MMLKPARPKQIRRSVIAVCAVLGLLASADVGKAAAHLQTFTVMTGRCTELVLPKENYSPACTGVLMNEGLVSGRSNFAFLMRTGSTVSFSGPGPERSTGTDSAALRIDNIIISLNIGPMTPPTSSKATGECRLAGNPFNGPSQVRCTARGVDGQYSAEFTTDGGTPLLRAF